MEIEIRAKLDNREEVIRRLKELGWICGDGYWASY